MSFTDMYKVAIFDVDGVINKSNLFSVQYQKLTGVSNEEMLPFFKGEFKDCLIGKAQLEETLEPWLVKWEWKGTVQEFLAFWFQNENNVDLSIVKVVLKLVDSGVKCVIATNQERNRTKYIWEDMMLNQIFGRIYSSADLGRQKTNPDFFRTIKEDLKCEFEEMIFIDDDEKNIDSARSLGINTHLFESNDEFLKFIRASFNNF